MEELRPFVETMRAAPLDEGPRLVLADWLEERGDPRAAWLRYVSDVWRGAQSLKPVGPAVQRLAVYHRSWSWRRVGEDVRRLWACACLRHLPTHDHQRVIDLINDAALLTAIVDAELFACGVLDNDSDIGVEAFRVNWVEITNDPLALAVYRASRSCRVDGACDAVLSHAQLLSPSHERTRTFREMLTTPINRRIAQMQAESWCARLAANLTRARDLPPPFRR